MPPAPLFETERDGDVVVVTVAEPGAALVDVDQTSEFGALLERVREPGVAGVVVDLGKVPYFGSMLLEALRNLWTHLRPHGQKMVLCCVADVGKEILRLARFDTLWPICATRDEAVSTIRGA